MVPDADDTKRLRQAKPIRRKTDHWDYLWPMARREPVAVLRKIRYDLYDSRTHEQLPPPNHKTYSIQSRSVAQALLTPDSGWSWNIDEEWKGQIIYNLPGVERALLFGEPVWITEGERDADTLREQGLTATCHYQGAAGPTEDQAALLSAATEINIAMDRDGTGILIADKWLSALVTQARIRVWWPADGHKDITEHVSAGLDLDKLGSTSARKLRARAKTARPARRDGPYDYGGRVWVPEDPWLRQRQLADWPVRYAPDRSEVQLARRIEQTWGELKLHDLDNCPTRIVMLARDRITTNLSVEGVSAPCGRWKCSKCYPRKVAKLLQEIKINTIDGLMSWVWVPATGAGTRPDAVRKAIQKTDRPYRTLTSERGHMFILAGEAVRGRGWEMTACPVFDFRRKLKKLLEPIEITRVDRGNGWERLSDPKPPKRYDALVRQYVTNDRYATERLAAVGLRTGWTFPDGTDESEARALVETAFHQEPEKWS